MPTYQYLCANGHPFERLQKMSDRPITKCPVCGAKAERQISGGSGLIFKGSGFYITDYGKDGKGPRKAPAEGGGSSGGEGGGTPKASEPAPAAPAPKPAPKSGSDT